MSEAVTNYRVVDEARELAEVETVIGGDE
jgi:hypothetical protein